MIDNQNTDSLQQEIKGWPEPTEEIIRTAQEAWSRKRRGSDWAEWMSIGAAHELGRAEAMLDAHSNKPIGRLYNAAFGAWLKRYQFDDMDKGDRCRLFECLDHRDAIETWRATLTASERIKLNHPSSVIRKWRASLRPPKQPGVSTMSKLQVQLDEARKRIHQLELARGDQWAREDTPENIAKIISDELDKLSAWKAGQVYQLLISQPRKPKVEKGKAKAKIDHDKFAAP